MYINYIKPKSAVQEEELIKIHDLPLNYKILRSLTDDRAWLEGDVIYLETSITSAMLKRDGGNNEDGTEIDVNPSKRKRQLIVKLILEYLDNDMVFLLVNIKDSHWYLANINAPKRVVQVLDSFGAIMNRNDLHKTLKGLSKYIKIVQETMPELTCNRWPDMDVTKWAVEEMLRHKTQTDSSSCGLFMLKYMEHFTGHELSEPVKQSDMSAFRHKMPFILFDTERNTNPRIFFECDQDPTPEITEPPVTTKGSSMGVVPGTSKITDPLVTTKKCTSGVFPGISEITTKQISDGLEPDMIIVVGIVRNLGWGEGYAHFNIDDCTGPGMLSFRRWLDRLENNMYMESMQSY